MVMARLDLIAFARWSLGGKMRFRDARKEPRECENISYREPKETVICRFQYVDLIPDSGAICAGRKGISGHSAGAFQALQSDESKALLWQPHACLKTG